MSIAVAHSAVFMPVHIDLTICVIYLPATCGFLQVLNQFVDKESASEACGQIPVIVAQ